MKIRSLAVGMFLAISLCVPSAAFSAIEAVSADALRAIQIKKEPLIIFDARNKHSYEQGHIAGAVLPFPVQFYRDQDLYAARVVPAAPDMDKSLREAMNSYDRNTPIVTYCNVNCGASKVLQLKLLNLGFTNVRAMEEGYQIWEAKGYPVVKPMSEAPKAS